MLNANYPPFLPYLETLTQISCNDDKIPLVNCNLEAVNFDDYKNALYSTSGNRPKSNDALCFTLSHNYFIEFKGGNASNVEENDLHKKNEDSVQILINHTPETEDIIRNNYGYVVVYNKEEESREEIGQELAFLAGERRIAFGLDVFEGTTFKNVYTVGVSEFENDFAPNYL